MWREIRLHQPVLIVGWAKPALCGPHAEFPALPDGSAVGSDHVQTDPDPGDEAQLDFQVIERWGAES